MLHRCIPVRQRLRNVASSDVVHAHNSCSQNVDVETDYAEVVMVCNALQTIHLPVKCVFLSTTTALSLRRHNVAPVASAPRPTRKTIDRINVGYATDAALIQTRRKKILTVLKIGSFMPRFEAVRLN